MEDKTTASGNEHITFLKFVTRVFENSFFSAKVLIKDSCSTNFSIATKVNKLLDGCSMHRFQLAVREVTEEQIDVVSRVHNFKSGCLRYYFALNYNCKRTSVPSWTGTRDRRPYF